MLKFENLKFPLFGNQSQFFSKLIFPKLLKSLMKITRNDDNELIKMKNISINITQLCAQRQIDII